MLKRILVALGGTEYTVSAIRHAVELAKVHDAEVTGVSLIDTARLRYDGPISLGDGHYAFELANDRLEKAKERTEWAAHELTEACQSAGVRYQIRHESGEPLTLMIDRARYYDLTVLGLRNLFEYDVISDPHSALVRLVQAGAHPLISVPKSFTPVQKVLIAYSGSMESARTMKQFVQMRLWPAAKLRIVNFEHEADEAQQLVGDAADYCRAHGFEVEVAFQSNSAKDHLLPYVAEWGADLLVVGNSVKNLLLRRIFGETALHAIQNASCPLFLAQ
jgi:nucleotide-binding universal stress UspA family protein